MLMITEQRNEEMATFEAAGALAGNWAIELEHCWRNAASSPEVSRIVVDLTEVTFVDEVGKELLRSMMAEGVELIARGILIGSIVEEIANESSIA